MTSSPHTPETTLVVDSIHGDIHLLPQERKVIDTASFQRLRHLKQLGMGQSTYPNATHTRFAHSLGVLGIMERVAQIVKDPLQLSNEQVEDIRLAGLLHDVGHYPYSHLMEKVDKVQLTEEFVQPGKTFDASTSKYPDHEELGELIVTSQQDLIKAVGGKDRACHIAALFRGTENSQLSKLVHSSLDMDRLDYLLRDAHATGVPYGRIDINYLLNNMRMSPKGLVGVSEKALPAAEQYLFARFFMYRTVYFHKTTSGLEEACKQLLRRLRDVNDEGIAKDGNAIRELAQSQELFDFTDAYVDRLVTRAAESSDPVIKALAHAIRNRRPPRLLKEVLVFKPTVEKHHVGSAFKQDCRHRLQDLASKHKIPLGQFLVCETPRLMLEERGSRLTEKQARDIQSEEEEQLIRIFRNDNDEPESIVSIEHSVLSACSNHFFQAFRLYVVLDRDDNRIEPMCSEVASWDQPA